MYTKFILNKDEVISIIALLASLRGKVKDIKSLDSDISQLVDKNFWDLVN